MPSTMSSDSNSQDSTLHAGFRLKCIEWITAHILMARLALLLLLEYPGVFIDASILSMQECGLDQGCS